MTLDYLINQVAIGRTLIFDLDDTIYPEAEFLFGAYYTISLNAKTTDNSDIYDFLRNIFLVEGRKNIFEKLMKNFPSIGLSVDDCINILRSYAPKDKIKTYLWFNHFIAQMKSDYILRIVTNGNINQQKNKLNSIDLSLPKSQLDVVFANQLEPKPAPASFWGLKNAKYFNAPIYVGDSITDFQYAKNLGIEYFDVGLLKVIDLGALS